MLSLHVAFNGGWHWWHWRLDSRSTRTLDGQILKLEYDLSSSTHKSKPQKTYRNPIIYAKELQEEMNREGLTQADLARKHGISRARVNQWLSLQNLPEKDKKLILAMGDNWKRQLITERQLRKKLTR